MRFSLCGVELGMSKDEVRELLGPPQIEGEDLWRYLSPRRGDPANPLPQEIEFHLGRAVRIGPGYLLMQDGQPIDGSKLRAPDGFLECGDAVYVRESLIVGTGDPGVYSLREIRSDEVL